MSYVIVSKLVCEHKKAVGWAYREAPDNDFDSGWRMLHGIETQDEADDPYNFALYELESIVEIDESILEILNAPVGSEFEKDDVNQVWIKVNSNPEPNHI